MWISLIIDLDYMVNSDHDNQFGSTVGVMDSFVH